MEPVVIVSAARTAIGGFGGSLKSLTPTDLGATTDKYKEVWANKTTGFVLNTLGVNFDSTSCDVNRLFYLPRHKKGTTQRGALFSCALRRVREIRVIALSEATAQCAESHFAMTFGMPAA